MVNSREAYESRVNRVERKAELEVAGLTYAMAVVEQYEDELYELLGVEDDDEGLFLSTYKMLTDWSKEHTRRIGVVLRYTKDPDPQNAYTRLGWASLFVDEEYYDLPDDWTNPDYESGLLTKMRPTPEGLEVLNGFLEATGRQKLPEDFAVEARTQPYPS